MYNIFCFFLQLIFPKKLDTTRMCLTQQFNEMQMNHIDRLYYYIGIPVVIKLRKRRLI